jgi:hypothetical protein
MSDAPADKCPRCGGDHAIIACPHVKAIELEHGGDFNSISRVEFLTPLDFPRETSKPADAPDGDSYPKLGASRSYR